MADFEDEKVAWDLRRIWAEKVIGVTVQQIQLAMSRPNYPLWFSLMQRDLRTEIFKNFSEEEREEVEDKIDKVKQIISENQRAYLNQSKNPEEHEKIDDALCELYILMTSLMDKNGLFGKGYQYDEDEI